MPKNTSCVYNSRRKREPGDFQSNFETAGTPGALGASGRTLVDQVKLEGLGCKTSETLHCGKGNVQSICETSIKHPREEWAFASGARSLFPINLLVRAYEGDGGGEEQGKAEILMPSRQHPH